MFINASQRGESCSPPLLLHFQVHLRKIQPSYVSPLLTSKEQKQLSDLAIKMDHGVQITEVPDLFLTRMNVTT